MRDTNGKTESFWGVPYFDTHPDAELADCRPLFSSLRHSLWIRPRLDIKPAWAVLAKQLITAPFLPLPDTSVCCRFLPVLSHACFCCFPDLSFSFVLFLAQGEPLFRVFKPALSSRFSPPPPRPKKTPLQRRGWIPASSEISLTWPGAEAAVGVGRVLGWVGKTIGANS